MKYLDCTDEIINLFDDVKNDKNIPAWLTFKLLTNNDQKKEAVKIVKNNELTETLSSYNFCLIINETIFDQLPDDMQKLLIVEALSGVVVSESEAISLEKPDFNTYRGVLEVHGHEEIIKLHESVKSLFDKLKEEEDAAKETNKKKRGRKPKL